MAYQWLSSLSCSNSVKCALERSVGLQLRWLLAAAIMALSSSLIVGADANAASVAPTSTVTIPIQEYLDLRQQNEKAAITSLENVRITGEYGKALEIIFSGSSQGRPTMVSVLGESPGMSLSDCSGSALLKFQNEENEVGLLPQAPRFQLKCRLSFKTWEEVTLLVKNALFVKVDVAGNEPSIDSTSMSDRRIVFRRAVRRVAEAPVMDEEPSVVARYQVSILPEETRFQYFFQIQNPNRASRNFEFNWVNGEVIQKVTFSGEHVATKTGYSFKLEPGENQATIIGRLPKPEFRSALKKALEYLVIENHPLLTVDMKSGARRVSLSDARVSPRFTGARAYLLGRSDAFNWQSKELQIFPTSTFIVNQAYYRYYWAPRGVSLVEGTFSINNQGNTEVPLKIPGKITYLEVNSVPQVLAQDETGRLIVKVPVGDNQSVSLQYQTEKNAQRTLASVSDDLVRPQTAMTNVSLDLTVPREKSFVYKQGFDGQMDWAGLDWRIAIGAVIFYMYYKLFELMGWSLQTRLFGAFTLGFLAIGVPGLFFWAMVFFLAILCIRARDRITSLRPTTWRGWMMLFAFSALGVLLYGAGTPSFVRFSAKQVSEESYDYADQLRNVAASPPSYGATESKLMARKGREGYGVAGLSASALAKQDRSDNSGPVPDFATDAAMVEDEEKSELGSSETYQGLPVKIPIPNDGYSLHFQGGLFDQTQPVQFTVLTMSRKLLNILQAVLWISLVLLMWRKRNDFREFLRLGTTVKIP